MNDPGHAHEFLSNLLQPTHSPDGAVTYTQAGERRDLAAEFRALGHDAETGEALAGIVRIAQAAGLLETAQQDGSVTAVCDRLARWCAERRGLTLAERVTSVLITDGFAAVRDGYDTPGPAERGRFQVGEGVGATVGVVWRDAPPTARRQMLVAMGDRLTRAGFKVDVRDGHLYVRPLPGEPRADLISPRPGGGS